MDKLYPLKHWGFTLLIAPILLTIYSLLSSLNLNILDILKGIIEGIAIYTFIVFVSSFFSLPTLLVYLLLFYILNRFNINPIYVKSVLIIIALVGIIITFQLIKGSAIETLTYIYAAVSLLVGSVLNIEKPKPITKKE